MPPTPTLSTGGLADAHAAAADLPADSPLRSLLAAYEALAGERAQIGLRRVTVWRRFDERPDRVRHRLAAGTRRLEQLTLPDGEVRYRIGNRWFRREELEHTYSFERLPASYREFVDMFGVQPPTGRRGVLSIYTRPATGQYVCVRLTTYFDHGSGMNHSDATPDAAFAGMLALAQMDGLTIEIDPSVDAFLAVATAYTWGENERSDRVIVRRPH